MEPVPRFSVVLAASAHPDRVRLLRLLVAQFCVVALRSDARGTSSAVQERQPDVLVSDPACSRDLFAAAADGRGLPATWVVVLDRDEPSGLPDGVTRLARDASDRRILSAVAAAGRYAGAGRPARETPATGRFTHAAPRAVDAPASGGGSTASPRRPRARHEPQDPFARPGLFRVRDVG